MRITFGLVCLSALVALSTGVSAQQSTSSLTSS